MKAILISSDGDEMTMDIKDNLLTLSVGKKDYKFSVKDYDDAEAFLKAKNNGVKAGEVHNGTVA